MGETKWSQEKCGEATKEIIPPTGEREQRAGVLIKHLKRLGMRKGVASVREGLELLEQLEELQLLRRASSSTKRGDARRITKALLRRRDAGILRAETCADDGDEDPHDGTQTEDDDEDIFSVESHSPRELKDDIRSLIFPRTHLQRLQRGQWQPLNGFPHGLFNKHLQLSTYSASRAVFLAMYFLLGG
eukprot:gb/GECG01015684.1/.p1 GENE.gb/GECG01015684.1/~~gb/GECG01015684.1/.p1  ORF type:complete len:188 (+),score=26.07 gb/GECG01015684.1/:1-564(+)